MRAAIVEAFGPFDGIRVKEIEAPSPAAGEILIRVSLAGVNFADAGMVSGRTPRRQPPFIPGVEAAGVVEAVGAGVTDHRTGDRVAYWDPLPRAFAELVAVPAWRAVTIAAGVPDEIAVALMVQGTTAHYLTTDSFRLGPGHTCLIHAAAGGVGQLLVSIAACAERGRLRSSAAKRRLRSRKSWGPRKSSTACAATSRKSCERSPTGRGPTWCTTA